jgi:hypothetical protein
MRNIVAVSVNDALAEGLEHLYYSGYKEESRNGPVLVSAEPVCTTYQYPQKRVLMSPMRDANPFFHLMESLWMLAGRCDVAWISQYNQRIASYSDDGKSFHGAYGYRWRKHFAYDQIAAVIWALKKDRNTRRAVLSMWDGAPNVDLGRDSKDIPCNTHAYFDTLGGGLNMTVMCRSNDMWWGAHGANAVHFSFLLEYMSAMTGLPMGHLRQFSNNYHIYLDVVDTRKLPEIAADAIHHDPYTEGLGGSRFHQRRVLHPGPAWVSLVNDPETFPVDLAVFMEEPTTTDVFESNPFFTKVAGPMARAWAAHKAKDYGQAQNMVDLIVSQDWRKACGEWIQRRREHVAG